MTMSSARVNCPVSMKALMLMVLTVFCGRGLAAPASDVVHLKVKDPHFGEALFYFYQDNYPSAMAHLAAFSKLQQLPTQKEDSDLLLGIAQLAYGMNGEAQESFERILPNKKIAQRTHDMAALYLARIFYKQGALEQAKKMHASIGDALPVHLKKEKDIFQVDLLVGAGRYQEAVQALPGFDDIDGVYSQHNLGMAMLRNGQLQQGINVLQNISAASFADAERRTLQDKTNLALAYVYLQAGDLNTAKSYFEKVRINGPFSSRALLGLGLAETASNQHQRALIPWVELQKRDMLEMDVQEVLLRIPETLFKLESYKKSQSGYQDAVSRYKAEIEAISVTMAAVRTGQITINILASGLSKKPLPTPEMRYFIWLMQNAEFRQTVSLYSEALDLRNTIAVQQDAVRSYGLNADITIRYTDKITENTVVLDDSINRLERHIQHQMIALLENRKASLSAYLSQANLGLAKVYHHAAERGDQ